MYSVICVCLVPAAGPSAQCGGAHEQRCRGGPNTYECGGADGANQEAPAGGAA